MITADITTNADDYELSVKVTRPQHPDGCVSILIEGLWLGADRPRYRTVTNLTLPNDSAILLAATILGETNA